MKNSKTLLPAAFGPETRFEVRPVPPVPFRGTQETEFERLRDWLLAQQLTNAPGPGLSPLLRRAANEAAALAWVTPFPLLMFPVLFEEKIEAGIRQIGRLNRIHANCQLAAA